MQLQKHKYLNNTAFVYIFSSISGFLLYFSFPPAHLGFLAAPALAVLLLLSNDKPLKSVFLIWLVSSIVLNTLTLYWIVFLMKGDLTAILVPGIVLGILFVSIYHTLPAVCFFKVRKCLNLKSPWVILLFPVYYLFFEVLKSLGDISFPWLQLGYTYGYSLALIQFLSVGGTYFYSLLALLSGLAIYLIAVRALPLKRALLFLLLIILIHMGLFIHGKVRLDKPKNDSFLTAGIIQGNVNLDRDSYDRSFLDTIFTLYRDSTLKTADSSVSLIVWPESAMQCYILRLRKYKHLITRLSGDIGVPILFGSLDKIQERRKPRETVYHVSSFLAKPGSRVLDKYDKIKLVPFSEQLPFEGLFPIISKVDLGESDFSPGKRTKAYSLKNIPFSCFICYEVVYPGFVRTFLQNGSRFFVQITNDAWFRRSGMPYQHLNIVRYRAIENAIACIRCANTGISCFIDSRGRISQKTEIFTGRAIRGSIDLKSGTTFYSRHGDIIGWICFILAPLVFVFALIQYRRRGKGS
jgi:apolipoprotein N-acyltransferase